MEPNCPGLNPDPLDISCMTIGNLTPLGVGSVFLGIYLQFHFHLRFIFILFNYLYDVCLHLRVCIGMQLPTEAKCIGSLLGEPPDQGVGSQTPQSSARTVHALNCRARSPDPQVFFSVQHGLTWECVRAGLLGVW